MPLLRRTKTPPSQPDQPAANLTIDPAYGDPDGAAVRAAMAAADWPAARRVLTAGHDSDDFAFLVDVASRVSGCEQWLPDAVRADLGDPLPLLIYGVRAIDWAWEARTRTRAKYVSRDQFQVFFDRLRLAEDCLQDVVRREPGNTAAWTGLVTLARGLQLGQDEAKRRFDRVLAHDPTHFRAHTQMLQQVCRKWSGSHGEMHAFAQQATANAPAGSRLGCLVAWAHLEEWLDMGTQGGKYFSNPQVLAELRTAARRSVCHPSYRPRKGWPQDRNPFAMTFALAGDQAAAAEQFRAIGDLVTELPWGYHSDGAIGGFTARRAKAYHGPDSTKRR
jgi:hypothetical protein